MLCYIVICQNCRFCIADQWLHVVQLREMFPPFSKRSSCSQKFPLRSSMISDTRVQSSVTIWGCSHVTSHWGVMFCLLLKTTTIKSLATLKYSTLPLGSINFRSSTPLSQTILCFLVQGKKSYWNATPSYHKCDGLTIPRIEKLI